jgi:ligand-binding sensor domain-containing protein/two-component sensor histidine kinase
MLNKKSLILILFLPLYSFAQNNFVFQHLTVEDGLLSNSRVNSFQDAEGFYWFSTFNGIQRFDGKNFISFTYNDNGTKNTSGEWVGKPTEDKEKNIWIINEEGINVYQRKHGGFTRLYVSDAEDSNTNNVCNILKDDQNKIWIITHKNIFQYDDKSGKAVLFSNILDTARAGIVAAIYDRKKNDFLLLISRNGFYDIASFDYRKNKISYVANPALKELLHNYKTIAFFKLDESSNLWISDYWGTLFKYNTITNELSHYSISQENGKEKNRLNYAEVYDFLDDNNGTIWFGGENTGLLKYDKNADSFTNIKYQSTSEYGLHYDQAIFSFFKDREGNIWIDTDLGMNIFNPHLQQFKYLNQNTEQPPTHLAANITSIFESSKKDIWVSTWGNGVFKYDSNFVFQKNYVYDSTNASSFGEPLNRAWTFGEDDKGKIWIGSQYGMVSILDPATGKFFNNTIPEFEHSTIMHIAEDKENNFWFGLYNGNIGKWNYASDKIAVYKDLYGINFKEPTVIDGLLADKDNGIWVGTSLYGLNRFNESKKIMDERALISQHVFSLSSISDSVIAGGTSGKGFFLFNKVSKTAKFYNTTNGLSSNIVFGCMPDNSHTIWVFASNGIERLNLKNESISHYNLNDGIKDHVFLRAFCKLKTGIFMATANSGIIYFNPDSITIKSSPPDVVITGFSADQQSFPVDSLLEYKTINLSYDKNVIAIQYASVSFIGRNTDQYFYQLDGIDRKWVSAGTARSVTYASLAPGNYTFKIKSQNADGIESAHITLLNFTIHPPWWQTWWAYLLWVILLCIAGYAVYKYRKRSSRALSNMRQRIATDLHDDIGSTLNSISVFSEIAGSQLETNQENAKSLLEKMGSASRNMIDTMNDIVWAVNPKNDYFENVLQRMQYFAGELLSGKNILLRFEVDANIKNIKLPMAKRKDFYLIFKEAINNTYKYADCKTVRVSIALEAQNIVMRIADDGVGFEENKSMGGNGLKNMETRAKEISAQLNITSSAMKGTEVELRMPV